ncbi:MAG: hypothetical protein U9M89_02020 [Patescibacteria group bacterium]|nr:hypothetical protein [Patescibacteria group bacterium]
MNKTADSIKSCLVSADTVGFDCSGLVAECLKAVGLAVAGGERTSVGSFDTTWTVSDDTSGSFDTTWPVIADTSGFVIFKVLKVWSLVLGVEGSSGSVTIECDTIFKRGVTIKR